VLGGPSFFIWEAVYSLSFPNFLLSSSTIIHSPSTSIHSALLHRSLHHIATTNRLQSSFFGGLSVNLRPPTPL
jgi:hypothetical protein